MKMRLDQLLVERGLVESKTKAQALILSGNVLIGTKRADKAGTQVADDADITIKGQEHPWVSRGGMKLAHACAHFAIDVRGMVAIDVGASTGGFTDVLLHQGADKVYAVDVGHGQLAWKLRTDARVVVFEKTNARYLTSEQIAEPVDIVVCDASFISLKTVLPAALALTKGTQLSKGLHPDPLPQGEGEEKGRALQDGEGAAPLAHLVTLIKPQFEVGKDQVGKGGVVRDAGLHKAVCDDIAEWVSGLQGWQMQGIVQSPITGPMGNVEFLLYAVKR